MNESLSLNIIEGKHPLLGKEAVPLSVKMDTDCRNLIITGPNTGGKTVTMKTIGLFVLMTQAGLHIPCKQGTSLTSMQ